ncbi:MAG: MFS transporter [Pseudomonadota bacterium]
MDGDEPSRAPTSVVSSPAERRLAYAILLSGTLVIGMGQTVVFAVLPPIARGLGLHDFQVLGVFMLSAVFWVSCGPLWGRQSDNVGRRPFILLGLGAYALSMILFATAIRSGMEGALSGWLLYVLMLAARSLYGAFGSAMPPAAQAYIADRSDPSRRTAALAGFSATFGLGAMLGPAFAGAAGAIGPLAPLYGVASLALLATVAIYLRLRERTPPKEKTERPKLSPFDVRIRAYLVFGLTISIATAIPTQFASFYAIDRLGVDAAEAVTAAGVALSAAAGASLFAQVALVQRFNLSPQILMRAGPALMCVGHVIVAASTDLGPFVFGMLLSGLGAGLVAPGFVGGASLAVSTSEQGAVAGLSNSAAAASFIVAPAIGYLIYAAAPWALFGLTAGLAASCCAFAFFGPAFKANQQ